MAISDEITRLQQAKAALKTSIEGKGVTVSSDATLDDYPALVDSIEAGGGGVSDNTWWFCSAYKKFSFTIELTDGIHPGTSMRLLNMEGHDVWFEYNGEKYYIDSVSDGTHILTKQGAPVPCNIFNFVAIRITKQGDVYSVYMEED